MNALKIKLIIALGLLATSLSALAVNPDELRGRVLEVVPEERQLTLYVLEVGEEVDATINTTRTYTVPEQADVEAGIRTDILDDYLEDIREDSIVTIEIDVGNPPDARNVRYE